MKQRLLLYSVIVFMSTGMNAADNINSKLGVLESSVSAIDTQLNRDASVVCSSWLPLVESKIDRDERDVLILQSVVNRLNSKLDVLSSKESSIDTTLIVENSKVVVAINFITDALNNLSQADSITSKMDQTAIAINSKLDIFVNNFLITQSDVVGGFLTLSTSGEYRLATDITATVTITAPDVSLDLDNHTITGNSAARSVITVGLNGNNAHICNGQVVAIAATTNAQAAIAAIEVDGSRVELNSLVITCNNTTATSGGNGQNGRLAINNVGLNTQINSCHMVAGNGANGAGTAPNNGGTGGAGISNSASSFTIKKSVVRAGAGGSAIVGSVGAGNGGSGGIGIDSSASNFLNIDDCEVVGGTGGDVSTAASTTNNGGSGGIGIRYSGNDSTITNSIIIAGNSGRSATTTPTTNTGGDAIQSSGTVSQRTVISGCSLQAGAGALGQVLSGNAGGAGGGNGILNVITDATIADCMIIGGVGGGGGSGPGVGGSNAGNGGIGIDNRSSNVTVQRCTIIGGSGGVGGSSGTNLGGNGGNGVSSSANNFILQSCNVTAGSGGNGGNAGVGGAGAGGTGGSGISNTALGMVVLDSEVLGGNGGATGTGASPAAGGSAGAGILNQTATLFSIQNCTIRGGTALTQGNNQGGGAGGHGIDNVTTTTGEILTCIIISGYGSSANAATTAGTAGNGINIGNGCRGIVAEDCLISTGAGGGGGGAGGSGGNGISLSGSSPAPESIAIRRCSVQGTGSGGNGTASGGSGGHGISLSTGNNTEVSNCVLSDTGIAGTGGTGISGQAIRQLAASTNGVFFGNYAYNIANGTAYSMAGTTVNATDAPAGTAITASTNRLDNVHAP